MQSLHEISATLANEALSSYLKQLLPSPDPIAHHAHSWLQRLGYAMGYGHAAPLDIWWKERPTRLPILWRVHTSFIRAIGGASATRVQREMPSDPVVCYWYNRYAIADNYARDYTARYRSAWFWGLGLGAMSLVFAALSTSVEGAGLKAAFTGFELCAMMLIILLVYLDGRLGWHTRSIEYRLLAELCRTQQGLSPLAWSIPVATMGNLAGSHRQVSRSHSRPRAETMEHSAWIAWLFAAWQRAAPLPSGQLDKSKLELAREAVLYDLIEDQINYHYERFRQYQRAGSTLIRLGEIAFLFVVFLVAAKLGMELSHGHHTLIQILSLTVAILSAFSAAVVGIRTYSELDLLSEQSIRMAGQLELAKEKIAIIRLDRALASQDLGVEVANVARLMLQDLEGWTRLFRAKEMEAN